MERLAFVGTEPEAYWTGQSIKPLQPQPQHILNKKIKLIVCIGSLLNRPAVPNKRKQKLHEEQVNENTWPCKLQ